MRASWSAFYSSLSRHLNRSSAEADFRQMGHHYPDLARFASIPSLMEHLHQRGGDPTAKFRVVRALVAAAQSDHRCRSTAHMMVMVILWPGLDAVLWRLARGFPCGRDDLPSEILARVGEAILDLDLGKVTAVTATLLRNVERDIRRDLIAARRIGVASRPIDDPAVEALAAAIAVATAVPDLKDDRVMAEHLAGLRPDDAHLLRRVFILGETQEEAGRSLGLKGATARKRVQRAVAKLQGRQKNSPELSHFPARVGL